MPRRTPPAGRHRRLIAFTIGLAACLAIAIPALGASIAGNGTVGGSVPGNRDAELQAYYPKVMTVRAGDRVRFTVLGFHTVTFVPKGKSTPGILVPTGATAPATNDPAGAPYWWGAAGVPLFGINPSAAAPSKSLVVTGTRVVSSGFPTGRKFTPTFTFPKPGTYTYHCIPHPGMTGTVVVLPRTAKAPNRGAQAARANRERAADRAALVARIRSVAKNPAANTVLVGVGTAHGAKFAFAPKALTVAAGTTVTFRMGGKSEIHTVTFGPQDQRDRLIAGFNAEPISPEAQYPTDAPGAPAVITPTSHGVGVVNSGVMFDPGTGPPNSASAFQATFTAAGTYTYVCIVHPDMVGTITVTP
ncbi:MAG: plastocyanin/azurin family copper-binding protein [Thermoleophilia bacterium]